MAMMMMPSDDRTMNPSNDETDPMASTRGADPRLQRMRLAVMSRVFGDAASPERIGRYEIERPIGSGAMGAVFAAHDPQLDRQVAVKLLHFTSRDAEGMRLLREAKALARLSHPNVVQVYDAGAAEDRVFLAMELVHGTDLHQWLHAAPRAWREVVDVFVAAGRGLAAAHAAGLVHRDFKPHNVLVGDDGVVKVADFGLVRAADGPAALPAATSERASEAPVETLTRTGAAVGTPAYMAPEQHLVLDTDARTDQFSFCVALYEGLVGERPFRAETLATLIEAVRSDRVEFPHRPWLPAALRRVIRRGLRASPADRFPNMKALLDALERARRSAWQGWALGVAAAGLVPLVALAGMGASSRPEAEVPAAVVGASTCDAEAKTRAIWDDAARERVRAHVVGAGSEIGERAAATATVAIDGYLQAWRDAYESTCEAATTSEEAQVLARRLCLEARLQETRGVISVLEQADDAIVANVPQIVAALEPIAQCEGELAVVRTPNVIDDGLRLELARARSLWHMRRPLEARAAAESLAQRAADVGDRMLASDAWLLVGIIDRLDVYDAERGERAVGALTAALEAARAVEDSTRALRAEVLIAGLERRGEPSTVAADLGRLATRVETSADPIATWMIHHDLYFETSDEATRAAHARRMLEVATSFGPGHRFVEISQAFARWSGVLPGLTAAQQADEAREVAAMFGADTPRAVEELEQLASQLIREGQVDEARLVLERAVVAWTTLVGPESSQVGAVWRRIGDLEFMRSDLEAALVAYERAIAALAANPITDHAGEVDVLASVSFVRAEVLLELGRAEEAVAAIEAAKPLRRVKDSDVLAELHGELFGRARLAAGDPEGALSEHVAARKTRPARFVQFDIGEGEALLALGRTKEARTLLRSAWERLEALEHRELPDQLQHIRAGLALARTLAAIDANDPEIATIATAALASLPTEHRPPSSVRMRDALVELSQ